MQELSLRKESHEFKPRPQQDSLLANPFQRHVQGMRAKKASNARKKQNQLTRLLENKPIAVVEANLATEP